VLDTSLPKQNFNIEIKKNKKNLIKSYVVALSFSQTLLAAML